MAESTTGDEAKDKHEHHGLRHVVDEIATNLEERVIAAEEAATSTASAEVNFATAVEAAVVNPHEQERKEAEAEEVPADQKT